MPKTITAPLFEKQATDVGRYWTSRCSKTAMRHYLRGCATTSFKTAEWRREWWEKEAELRQHMANITPESFQKSAAIGGDQEGQFEQAFSSLAYSYLKDKSPRLLDFIVGFQLVDRNEDNTKAIGIFGFKVGEQWLYAPVFFLNGDMKGHELLYIKNQDLFVPLKENWVNYLISRKPHVLGESSPQKTHQLGGLMPNLRKLSRPPMSTKSGSDEGILVDEWARPMLPVLGAFATKQAFDDAHAALSDKLDLRRFLSLSPALVKLAYEKCYLAYPALKVAFDKFYGPNFFADVKTAADVATTDLVTRAKRASFVLPPKKKKSPFLIEPKEEEKVAHPIRTGELRVLRLRDYLKTAEDKKVDMEAPGGFKTNKPELTEEEREKLLKDGVLIKDERDPVKTSVAYNTQVRMELSNPMETGLYEILEKPGKFDEMLVISAPHDGSGKKPFALAIRKSAPKNWINTHATNLWAKQCDCPVKADFVKYVEGLDDISTLTKGGTYVAIGEKGAGTVPFTVREVFENGTYRVDYQNYARYGQERSAGLPKVDSSAGNDPYYSGYDALVHINQREGSSLRSTNGELSIPKSFKLIKISDPPKPDKNKYDIMPCCGPAESGSEDSPIQPGSIVDVQMALHEKQAKVHIHDVGGNEVYIKSSVHGSRQMDKQAAVIDLVCRHGFTETMARDMLKEAAASYYQNRPVTFFVKYASPFLQPGPDAPQFPEPMTGTEQNGYNSVASIYPQEDFMPVPGMDSHDTDPSVYDPFFEPDRNAMQVAQEASNSGQKEVFDSSMISGMLKAVRQDSLVDRYLGDLMKALDKIARILFMFYWHQEEFEDRYGKQDLPELEDSLRNAFEMLGDVVLFLKEKSVGGGAGLEMSGVGKSSPSEPNLEETARN